MPGLIRWGTFLVAAVVLRVVCSCSPDGAGDEIPAVLEVSPDTLAFSGEDSRFIEVGNAGGGTLAFEIALSAEVDGVTWLKVEPASGAVAGGASKSVLVQLINQAALKPGSYLGEITVEAEGQTARKVLVTLAVGQPALGVVPDTAIDFGSDEDKATLVVTNQGKGDLLYSIAYPGAWIKPDSSLTPPLSAGESATFLLTVDRGLVPWYGPGEDDVVITSNGLTDAEHQGTRKLAVKVTVDASCNQDADCAKPGYYCAKSAGAGACTARKTNGGTCGLPNECLSGFCAEAHCCDSACTEPCRSCGRPGLEGTCSLEVEQTPCDDGDICTATDVCQQGLCTGSGTPDCSDLDTACGIAVCVPEMGGCFHELPPGKCLIDEECYDEGQVSAEHFCLSCDPTGDPLQWSVAPGTCRIGGACYQEGDKVIGECLECDPEHPGAPSSSPDGKSCEDDGNACTEDLCKSGSCTHQPLVGASCDDSETCTKEDACNDKGECKGQFYSCDDDLECTQDSCDGGGGCTYVSEPDGLACLDDGLACTLDSCQVGACAHEPDGAHCLIDGQCVDADASDPNNVCLVCLPGLQDFGYSPVTSLPCPEDSFACTTDLCHQGECTHEVKPGFCLIGGKCVAEGTPGPSNSCVACQTQLDINAWTPANEGAACDDKLFCVVGEVCVNGACKGQELDCGDACNLSVCSEDIVMCVPVPVADGMLCDDLKACTVGDVCTEGICEGIPKDCAAELEATPCTEAVCQPGSVPVAGKCALELKAPGSSCDDGKACTQNTTCTALGICSAGEALTAELCAELLGVTGQCASAVCEEPGGCKKTVVADGNDCQLANALAKCQQGECVIVSCKDASYGNCDGKTDNGCEAKLWQDIEHCGKCGQPCAYANAWADCKSGNCSLLQCMDGFTDCDGKDATGCESNTDADVENCGVCGEVCTSANAAKVGICVEGGCVLQACPPDWWNMDGDPANGCECSVAGPELCNGYDDNCDGKIDEGFDLFSDPDNCGACGTKCVPTEADSVDCLNGRCMVTACPEGFVDKNGLADDGCEYELFHVGELWVDALNVADPQEDGSQQHPFDTLQEGLAAAFPSYLVHVAGGVYIGPFLIDKPGIVIAGTSADQVFLAGTAAEATLLIKASDVAVTAVSVSGGRIGIHFLGTPGGKLASGAAADVKVTGVPAPGGLGLAATGILIEYADQVTVSNADVSGFVGGTGKAGSTGGDGSGVSVFWSDDAVIVASTIGQVTSGTGGKSEYTAGRSGIAAGVRLDHSAKALLAGNIVAGITGAMGASSPGNYARGATGGLAAGIYAVASTGNVISANALSNLKGGVGVPNPKGEYAGRTQEAFGVYLSADSLESTIDAWNRVEDDVIVYLYGASAETVSGLKLTSKANTTNLGKIVVLESSNIQVTGCTVENVTGEAGQTGPSSSPWAGSPGGTAAGIRLENCSDCLVADNFVNGVKGGHGGNPGRNGGGCVTAGAGAVGAGILISASAKVQIHGNWAGNCSGGAGAAEGYVCGKDGTGGEGNAYRLVGNSLVAFNNNAAAAVKGGWGVNTWPNRGACVHVDESSGVILNHLVCFDAGAQGSAPGAGVQLGSKQTFAVKVTNSIVSTVAGYCLQGLAANPALLHATYSDLFGCTAGQQQNALVVEGCISLDPLFENAAKQVLTLQATSPCLDAGDPEAACGLEPAPNGCRVNLGHTGNTAQATSAPGAAHCNLCPEP